MVHFALIEYYMSGQEIVSYLVANPTITKILAAMIYIAMAMAIYQIWLSSLSLADKVYLSFLNRLTTGSYIFFIITPILFILLAAVGYSIYVR